MSCADDQTEIKVGEEQNNVLEASACYSGGKSDHICCIHDNKAILNVNMNCLLLMHFVSVNACATRSVE